MTPEMIRILGTAATLYGLGGALSVLLQARRMHVRGASGDVSVRFFAVYVGGFAVWLLYGLGIGDAPIIVVHAVGLLCGTITLAVALRLRAPAATAATARSAGEDRGRVRPGQTLPGEPEHRARRAGRRNDERPEPETTLPEPVSRSDGERALGCPDCGRPDHLDRLPEEAGRHACEETGRRQPTAA